MTDRMNTYLFYIVHVIITFLTVKQILFLCKQVVNEWLRKGLLGKNEYTPFQNPSQTARYPIS
jgi:hypothetical protein